MKIIGLSGPSRQTGMTLMETLVSMLIVAIVISATINGYILSTNRADWSSQSLAAHSLALQRLEQVRAATWNISGETDVDQVTSANFPVVQSVLDLPVSGTNVVTATSGDQTRWGGTIGAGVEYGFAPNWSAAVEYDHIFSQDKNVTFTTTPGGLFAGTDRVRQDVDLVTARVNYRWGGPVVPKY